MKWFARAGYAARGLIYLVIGFFALLAAAGAGRAMGSRDALDELLSHDFGGVLAYALAAGLLFYGLWRLTQAIFDADGHGLGAKGAAVRSGLLVSGLTYLTLAAYCSSLGFTSGGEGGGFSSWLASFVGARPASTLLALLFAGVGAAHIVKAFRETYAERLQASERGMAIIYPISKIGLVARGLVFMAVAALFATRAIGGGTGEVGSREALRFVQDLPAGGWLLAAMGAGLIAFAIYSFIEARYRRIDVPHQVKALAPG